MEKRLIVVQNAFDDLKITEQSIKSIRYAANRWQSNYYEITHFQFPQSPSKIMWDRIWAMENFLEYDKVLILDPDIVINVNAPNIFDELNDEYDLAVVLDGNPGRFEKDFLRNGIVKNISKLHNSIEIFKQTIENFDENTYWNWYFNNGVFLFKPKKMYEITQKIKNLIYNNNIIHKFIDLSISGDSFPCQNLINVMISHSNLSIKTLHNNWNWTIPDIVQEYTKEFFLSDKMIPYIYHFTGTHNSKEFLKTYVKWNMPS
jgi:lipopolysaccharide biosynthesis glycosyltransferase